MINYELAKEWGVKMASLTRQGGIIGLGLVGSGLNTKQVKKLFQEINSQVPVKYISSKVGVGLCMEKI